MRGLHCRGVHALLEQNGYAKRSITFLVQDKPEIYKWLKAHLLENELFLLLNALETKRNEIDSTMYIFMDINDRVVVFDRKEKYSKDYCCNLCAMANLSESLISEYKNVTPANYSQSPAEE